MTKSLILFAIFICVGEYSFAQEKRILKHQQIRKINPDSIKFYVNGYKSNQFILQLFKPSEINFNEEKRPDLSQAEIVMQIHVRDSNHLVLQYLKYKASLQVNDKLFKHGEIPKNINPEEISEFRYVESKDHIHDILEVQFYVEEFISDTRKIRYSSTPQSINYYDIDGRIYTKSEMQELQISMSVYEHGPIISGKEAVEKYGDSKFASGVAVLRKRKN